MMETLDLAAESLRKAYGTFPTGVVAVAGMDGTGAPAGMAVSSFVSISLDPPLVGFCVQKTSRTWPALREIPMLGISILSAGHDLVARQLAAKSGNRFADAAVSVTDRGAVHVGGASALFECHVTQEVDAGDHFMVIMQVNSVILDGGQTPLVFHNSKFVDLAVPAVI